MAENPLAVTVAGAGDNSGDSWANAMDYATWDTHMTDTANPEDHYYVTQGTYTLTSQLGGTRAGAVDTPIKATAVKSGTTNFPPVASDYSVIADGNHVVIAGGANYWRTGAYWHFRGFEFTGTGAYCLLNSSSCVHIDCSGLNSSGTAGRYVIQTGSYSQFFRIDMASTNGKAIVCGADNKIMGAYLHNSDIGANFGGGQNAMVTFCIFDTCATTGCYMNGGHAGDIINCTFYNNGEGLDYGNKDGMTVMNSAFCGNTTNITIDASESSHNVSYYSNYEDGLFNNFAVSATDTANACGFTDAPNGDFSLTESSLMRGAGFNIARGVSTAGTISQGAWQPAAGAGGLLMANKRGNKQ